jgi:predicted nucleic acid-binding protein
MAEAIPRAAKQLALDTNVLFDLAAGADFARDFLDACHGGGYALYAPPTVIAELSYKHDHGSPTEHSLAREALTRFREWRILPYILPDLSRVIAERFSEHIRHHLRLLPAAEDNDAHVLAETSLHRIPVLITSDTHLLDIDPDALLLALQDRDLWEVHVMSPRRFAKVFYR